MNEFIVTFYPMHADVLPLMENPLVPYSPQVDKNVDQGKLNCPLEKDRIS